MSATYHTYLSQMNNGMFHGLRNNQEPCHNTVYIVHISKVLSLHHTYVCIFLDPKQNTFKLLVGAHNQSRS